MTDEEKAKAALDAIMKPLAEIIELLKEIREQTAEVASTLGDVTANRREFHVRES